MRTNIELKRYAAALVAIVVMMTAAAKSAGKISENDILKSQYVFLETANYQLDEDLTDFYMLCRHAHRLNPSDPYIAGALGAIELYLVEGNVTQETPAYVWLKRRFQERPLEQNYYLTFANAAYNFGFYDDAIAVWELLDSLQPNRTDPAMNMAAMLKVKARATNDTTYLHRSIAIYERLQKGLPGSFSIASAKIEAYAALRDTAAILNELERVCREAPADKDCLLGAARVYNFLGVPDLALSCLQRADSIYPNDGVVAVERAKYYNTVGDTIAYRQEVNKAIASPTLEFTTKFQLFGTYLNAYVTDSIDNPEAARLFNTFEEVNPGEPVLHELYGDYLDVREHYTEAAEQYRYSIDLDPSDQDVWDKLIQCYAIEQDIPAMKETSTAATRRFREDLYAALVSSTCHYTDEDYVGAIAMLDSVQVLPTHRASVVAQVFAMKGDIYSKIEMPDSAIANYERAIAIDADNYMALNNAAYFMAEQNRDLSRAEIYASIACAAQPGSATFLDTYAWIMFKKQDYRRAVELIERALDAIAAEQEVAVGEQGESVAEEEAEAADSGDGSATGDYFEIYSHAGDIYFMAAQPDKAVEYWQQALELHPDDELLKRKVTNRAYYYD